MPIRISGGSPPCSLPVTLAPDTAARIPAGALPSAPSLLRGCRACRTPLPVHVHPHWTGYLGSTTRHARALKMPAISRQAGGRTARFVSQVGHRRAKPPCRTWEQQSKLLRKPPPTWVVLLRRPRIFCVRLCLQRTQTSNGTRSRSSARGTSRSHIHKPHATPRVQVTDLDRRVRARSWRQPAGWHCSVTGHRFPLGAHASTDRPK